VTASRDERPLKVRLKTKKNRTVSQKRWLERQLNDPYVARAKREGMRSRAAYKLIEIDDKYHLLKVGGRVVDLGAAPGGWSEMAAKRVGGGAGKGKVVAIDLLEMAPIAGVDFLQLDLLDPTAPERLTWFCPTWRRMPPATRRPISSRSWRWWRPASSSRAKFSVRAAASSPRCCKAAPIRRCWRRSSATLRP